MLIFELWILQDHMGYTWILLAESKALCSELNTEIAVK